MRIALKIKRLLLITCSLGIDGDGGHKPEQAATSHSRSGHTGSCRLSNPHPRALPAPALSLIKM